MTSNDSGETPNLEEPLRELLASFQFTAPQKIEIWDAYKANPSGMERCALRAASKSQRQGRTGAGLLLMMVRTGEHLLVAEPDTPITTGWRWVRGDGGAAGTFVSDPNGVDRLPPNYDFTTHNPDASRPSVRYEDDTLRAIPDEVREQLRKLGVHVESS